MHRAPTGRDRSGHVSFAPVPQVEATNNDNEHSDDDEQPPPRLSTRDRFRSQVQQVLRQSAFQPDLDQGSLHSSPALSDITLIGGDYLELPIQQFDEVDIGDHGGHAQYGDYIEYGGYYGPEATYVSPTKSTKDGLGLEVRIATTDLGLSPGGLYIDESQQDSSYRGSEGNIEKQVPVASQDYKPDALRRRFLVLLFVALVSLLGLTELAFQILPDASKLTGVLPAVNNITEIRMRSPASSENGSQSDDVSFEKRQNDTNRENPPPGPSRLDSSTSTPETAPTTPDAEPVPTTPVVEPTSTASTVDDPTTEIPSTATADIPSTTTSPPAQVTTTSDALPPAETATTTEELPPSLPSTTTEQLPPPPPSSTTEELPPPPTTTTSQVTQPPPVTTTEQPPQPPSTTTSEQQQPPPEPTTTTEKQEPAPPPDTSTTEHEHPGGPTITAAPPPPPPSETTTDAPTTVTSDPQDPETTTTQETTDHQPPPETHEPTSPHDDPTSYSITWPDPTLPTSWHPDPDPTLPTNWLPDPDPTLPTSWLPDPGPDPTSTTKGPDPTHEPDPGTTYPANPWPTHDPNPWPSHEPEPPETEPPGTSPPVTDKPGPSLPVSFPSWSDLPGSDPPWTWPWPTGPDPTTTTEKTATDSHTEYPGTKPTEDVPTTGQTAPTAGLPTSNPDIPTVQPTMPTSHSTVPTSDPAIPTSEPAEPTSQPAASTSQLTFSNTVPAVPTSDLASTTANEDVPPNNETTDIESDNGTTEPVAVPATTTTQAKAPQAHAEQPSMPESPETQAKQPSPPASTTVAAAALAHATEAPAPSTEYIEEDWEPFTTITAAPDTQPPPPAATTTFTTSSSLEDGIFVEITLTSIVVPIEAVNETLTDFASIYTDSDGVPTSTELIKAWVSLSTTVYTDADGRPTKTDVMKILSQPRKTTMTDFQGRATATLEYYAVETLVTLTDSLGRPTATETSMVAETAVTSTYFDSNHVATKTETILQPISSVTTTKVITPTPTAAGSADGDGQKVLELASISDAKYFAGLMLPTLVAVVISIPIRVLDRAARLYQPFHALSQPEGATAAESLCLETSGVGSLVAGLRALRGGRVLLSLTGLLVVLSALLVPISSEVFRVILQGEHCTDGETPLRCTVAIGVFPAPARAAVALLAVMAVATGAVAVVLWRWRTGVDQNPWSLKYMAGLAVNQDVRSLLERLRRQNRRISNKEATTFFRGKSFAFSYWEENGVLKYSILIRNEVRKPSKVSWADSAPKCRIRIGESMPFFILTWAGRILFLLLLSAVMIAVLTYDIIARGSEYERGLTGKSIGVRFLFTCAGVLVTFLWGSFFYAVAFLSPYRLLHSRRVHKGQAIYLTPPTNAFSGLWFSLSQMSRDLYLSVVAGTTILSEVLPLLLGNIPCNGVQMAAAEMVCTWMSVTVLSVMILTVAGSFVVTWPSMSMDPSTVAGAMYYACAHVLSRSPTAGALFGRANTGLR